MPLTRETQTNKESKEKIRIKFCPLTSGFRTRMTMESFVKACTRIRMNEGSNGRMIKDNSLYAKHCKECGGRPPKELTILRLEDF